MSMAMSAMNKFEAGCVNCLVALQWRGWNPLLECTFWEEQEPARLALFARVPCKMNAFQRTIHIRLNAWRHWVKLITK